jgi:hypothetical protein
MVPQQGDLLNIIRIKDYILSLEIVNQSETSTSEVSKVVKYKVTTTRIASWCGFKINELAVNECCCRCFWWVWLYYRKNGAIIEMGCKSRSLYLSAYIKYHCY